MQIQHHRQIQPAFVGGDVGDVSHPNMARTRRDEVLLQQVLCPGRRMVRVRRGLELFRRPGPQTLPPQSFGYLPTALPKCMASRGAPARAWPRRHPALAYPALPAPELLVGARGRAKHSIRSATLTAPGNLSRTAAAFFQERLTSPAGLRGPRGACPDAGPHFPLQMHCWKCTAGRLIHCASHATSVRPTHKLAACLPDHSTIGINQLTTQPRLIHTGRQLHSFEWRVPLA